jgi:hypothetical protein
MRMPAVWLKVAFVAGIAAEPLVFLAKDLRSRRAQALLCWEEPQHGVVRSLLPGRWLAAWLGLGFEWPWSAVSVSMIRRASFACDSRT